LAWEGGEVGSERASERRREEHRDRGSGKRSDRGSGKATKPGALLPRASCTCRWTWRAKRTGLTRFSADQSAASTASSEGYSDRPSSVVLCCVAWGARCERGGRRMGGRGGSTGCAGRAAGTQSRRDHQVASALTYSGGYVSTIELLVQLYERCRSTGKTRKTCTWRNGVKGTHVVCLPLFFDGVVMGVEVEEDGRE
jgi:hypothetical protein